MLLGLCLNATDGSRVLRLSTAGLSLSLSLSLFLFLSSGITTCAAIDAGILRSAQIGFTVLASTAQPR